MVKRIKTNLIIFDCDGVLIDSEIIVHKIGAKEMTRFGFPLTVAKSIELFSGVPDDRFPDIIKKEYGKELATKNREIIHRKIKATYQKKLKSTKNISLVINYLGQKQINKCIASNGIHEHITSALILTGLDSYFEREKIFDISMVANGKPMPDLFLHAAEQLQVEPQNCLVIEDSVVGITAAKAANMPVIGFSGAAHAQNNWYRNNIMEAKPNLIVNDAIELLNELQLRGI